MLYCNLSKLKEKEEKKKPQPWTSDVTTSAARNRIIGIDLFITGCYQGIVRVFVWISEEGKARRD